MAKKEITHTSGAGTAIKPAGPARSVISGAMIEGRSASQSIARVALFQGTAEEEVMYGDEFKRGDFIETLEKRNLGKSIEIVPVAGWVTWSKFLQGSKAPVYTHRNRADVPPEDLEWTEEGGNRRPPAASETVNMVVIVNGEPFPCLFLFKRTGIKAYTRVIEPCETRFGRCVYTLTTEDDKNPSGQPFKRLTAKLVRKLAEGDPLLEIVNTIEAEYRRAKAAFETASTTTEAATKDIPF